jgi:serine/threonine-protein kinase RsbW
MASPPCQPVEQDVLDFEIRCPVKTRVLSILRNVATCVAREAGFCEEDIDQIEMAVDEACANVIRHAYSAGSDGQLPKIEPADFVLHLQVCVSENRISFRVRDRGVGLDKKPGGARSIEEYVKRGGKGGLGIYIIRNFMDEVDYECPPGEGTILTMTKYLKA